MLYVGCSEQSPLHTSVAGAMYPGTEPRTLDSHAEITNLLVSSLSIQHKMLFYTLPPLLTKNKIKLIQSHLRSATLSQRSLPMSGQIQSHPFSFSLHPTHLSSLLFNMASCLTRPAASVFKVPCLKHVCFQRPF